MTAPSPTRTGLWRRRLAGGMFLVTGAGLVVHLLVGLPLWLTVAGGLLLAAAGLLYSGRDRAAWLAPVARVGVVSGAVATVAYDVSRWLFVVVAGSSLGPFAAWPLFGVGLVGPTAPYWAQWSAGVAYHATNGLLFGVAYTTWLGRRGPLYGIAFALLLEAFMLGLYPGWLHIKAYGEFAQMSMVGHVVYGTVLGVMSRRLLRTWAPAGSR